MAEDIVKAGRLYAQGNYSEAIKVYTKVLKENASSPTLLCNRASAYMRMDLFKTAIKDCDNAISLDKSYQKAYLLKGKALFFINKRADALKVWKEGSDIGGDVDLFAELYKYANELETPSTSTSTSTTATTTPSTISTPAIIPTPTPVAIPSTPPTPLSPAQEPPTQDNKPRQKGQTYERGNDGTWKTIEQPFYSKHPAGPPPAVETPITINNKPNITLNETSVAASALVAARGMVQHGVGKAEIDEKIALGYLQVNTGNHVAAIEHFSALLRTNPKIVAAYLGRGTAYALSGSLEKATVDFSLAIEVDKGCVDAWKRRGQARAARGLDTDAIADLTQAIVLSSEPDSESYHQRGLVYYKLHNYKRALADFKKAATHDKQNKLSWNHIGLCLNAIGLAHEAIEAHARATVIDPTFKEAWANMAQAYRDLGMHEKAAMLFDKSLEIDPRYTHSFHLRALLRFGVGAHKKAWDDIAVQLASQNKDFRHMRGVLSQDLGMLAKAAADYSIIWTSKPYLTVHEVALFTHHKLDTDISTFNIDQDMDPYFKEGWCKRNHPATLSKYKSQPPLSKKIPDVVYNASPSTPEERKLNEEAAKLGSLLQYDAEGYLPNARQQLAAGLAILEIAQRLKAGIWLNRSDDSDIVDGSNSSWKYKSKHKFGWRDLYDIAVKWRQYSEPNDPVWWVDLLSPEQFAEGFGSHTPMVTGQTHVIRYYPMFARSFAIMKHLIPEQCNITEESKRDVEDAKECKDLYEIMRKDFYVVTPCHSIARPGSIMEGTRLTIQLATPEGFEYSIRTPGTPPRWKEYDEEMTFVWKELTQAATAPEPDMEKVADLILTLTFYWYNFMPLSRGTAAVGYMTMIAMFLALGYRITAAIPERLQPDWEGILRPRPEEFISVIKPWLWSNAKKTQDLKALDNIPDVARTVNTIRKMITILNCEPRN